VFCSIVYRLIWIEENGKMALHHLTIGRITWLMDTFGDVDRAFERASSSWITL
jgi:hypothetical protein